MKYRLIAVGKMREPYLAQAAADFRTRLGRYETYDEIEVAPGHGGDAGRAVRDEGERILAALRPGDVLWLLERSGSALSSEELAARLVRLAETGASRIVFAIAGPYGASEALAQRADFRWSLSPLTFLHEWARAIVLEQLYRAAKIARNEPYHH